MGNTSLGEAWGRANERGREGQREGGRERERENGSNLWQDLNSAESNVIAMARYISL